MPLRTEERQNLLAELERQAENSDMNIDHLLSLYKQQFPGEALWRLTQDINRQALIWSNIIEQIKRSSDPEATAQDMKRKFETEYEVIIPGTIDFWPWDLEKAFDKVRNYSKGLLTIAARRGVELLREINVQTGVTATVQVQLSIPPGLTIGYETNFTLTS
jgi:hypothetical protein